MTLIILSAHAPEDVSLIYMILLSALSSATVLSVLHFLSRYLQKRIYNKYIAILDAERQQKIADIQKQINKQRDEIRRQRKEGEEG